jgi:hypothetical protein
MRAKAQLLTMTDLAGVVRERWQMYWAGTITYSGHEWHYMQFDAPGVADGDPGSERNISVVMAATSRAVRAFERALAAGWLVQLTMYEFDAEEGQSGPPSGMELTAQFDGQAVSGKATVSSLTLDLGTALAPVGATVPPRILTTALMGVGARL